MTSSQSNEWATPAKWFEYLDLEFGFTLDPCCQPGTAKCRKFFTPQHDGLKQSWSGERVFMNPPYGRVLKEWMRKAYESAKNEEALVVCLVPARVETEWFQTYAMRGEVRFPKGRITFEGASHSAPFPVAIVIFRPRLNS